MPTSTFSEFFKTKLLTWSGWNQIKVEGTNGKVTFSSQTNSYEYAETHPSVVGSESSLVSSILPANTSKSFKKISNLSPIGSKISFYFAKYNKKSWVQIVFPLGTFGAYILVLIPE
jgi:hypothetical protein